MNIIPINAIKYSPALRTDHLIRRSINRSNFLLHHKVLVNQRWLLFHSILTACVTLHKLGPTEYKALSWSRVYGSMAHDFLCSLLSQLTSCHNAMQRSEQILIILYFSRMFDFSLITIILEYLLNTATCHLNMVLYFSG